LSTQLRRVGRAWALCFPPPAHHHLLVRASVNLERNSMYIVYTLDSISVTCVNCRRGKKSKKVKKQKIQNSFSCLLTVKALDRFSIPVGSTSCCLCWAYALFVYRLCFLAVLFTLASLVSIAYRKNNENKQKGGRKKRSNCGELGANSCNSFVALGLPR
jgi:hypothetical protein